MKRIKWLTEDDVKKAAEAGRKTAILCSMKHWIQLSSASKRALLAKVRQVEPDIAPSARRKLISLYYCSLCQRYNYIERNFYACGECRLYCLKFEKGNSWFRASQHLAAVQYGKSGAWKKWKKASRCMVQRIKELYRKEYGRIPRGYGQP